MLDERKLRILQAIIDDYTTSAVPVGSRTITRKYDMGVSPATIRNEMSDLEDLGYLVQPHVSAGRIPSGKAFRLYADMLLEHSDELCRLNRETEQMDNFFRLHINRPENADEEAAKALSQLTRYTSLVLMPGQLTLRIATMQLVPMPRGSALLVIVTDGGIVRDAVIHVSSSLDADGLYTISRMLTERFRGMTLREVQEALSGYVMLSGADTRVLSGIAELTNRMQMQAAVDSLSVGGAHNILNYPEYSDVLKARAFMTVMEAKEKLISVMKASPEGFAVLIGDEIGLPETRECALLTAQYRLSAEHNGVLGLLGPIRMPYKNMIKALNACAGRMTNLFYPGNDI